MSNGFQTGQSVLEDLKKGILGSDHREGKEEVARIIGRKGNYLSRDIMPRANVNLPGSTYNDICFQFDRLLMSPGLYLLDFSCLPTTTNLIVIMLFHSNACVPVVDLEHIP